MNDKRKKLIDMEELKERYKPFLTQEMYEAFGFGSGTGKGKEIQEEEFIDEKEMEL